MHLPIVASTRAAIAMTPSADESDLAAGVCGKQQRLRLLGPAICGSATTAREIPA